MTLLSVQEYADDDEQNHYPDSQKHVLCFGKRIVNPHLSLLSEPELALADCTPHSIGMQSSATRISFMG